MLRSRRTKRQPSGRVFPWREAVPGLLVGVVAGTFFAIAIGQQLSAATSPAHLPDEWTYRYTGGSLLVVFLVGAAVVAAGVVLASERQFWNYVAVGVGAGIAVLGTTYLSREKVEARPDGAAYRTWWGLPRTEVVYADLEVIQELRHSRPGKRERRSLHYETKDGRREVFFGAVDRSRLMFWATVHILRSAAAHGVQIRKGNTHAN
jgi:hypothetical protein